MGDCERVDSASMIYSIALLSALVAACHASQVDLMVVETGLGFECDIVGNHSDFWQYGVSYSIDNQKLFAVEYHGKDAKCCSVTVHQPTTTTTPAPEKILWRSDYRCGPGFKNPEGTEAICNPNSGNKCCSPYGWCDASAAHCTCSGCKDDSKILGTTTTTTTTTPKPLNMAELNAFTSNMRPCSSP